MNLEKLQRQLGYSFSSEKLLSQALTHRSYGAQNNERIEFLGDSILNFVIAENLFLRFCDASEGQLSRLRAKMVRRQTLAEVAREFKLGDYLIMGSGELKSGGYQRESILSDTLEAIIGAMFLEAGLDTTKASIIRWFNIRLDGLSLDQTLKDAKSRLQEYLQSCQAGLPVYLVTETRGQSHEQTFYIECRCSLLESAATGEGSSRRTAEQNAAMAALEQLGIEHEHS
ncbi:MAG: ribonuclease III [Pseudomonadales bacterium]|nr:ribonuclease III [Pseudomonadales bacterium]